MHLAVHKTNKTKPHAYSFSGNGARAAGCAAEQIALPCSLRRCRPATHPSATRSAGSLLACVKRRELLPPAHAASAGSAPTGTQSQQPVRKQHRQIRIFPNYRMFLKAVLMCICLAFTHYAGLVLLILPIAFFATILYPMCKRW